MFGDGKFISLFSMLFGYGFTLQLQRLEARGEPAVRIYGRRLIGLALIGIAHSMLWWGDILRSYAMMGVLLLFTRRWQAKTLAWSGLVLSVVCVVVPTITSIGPEADAYQRAYRAFSGDSFFEMFRGNRELNWFEFARYPWLFPFVLSRFLIGSAAGKAGVLADPAAHRSLLRRLSLAGVIVGFVSIAVLIAFEGTTNTWFAEDAQGWNLLLGLNTLGFAVAYACWFALLFIRARWHSILRHLAPVGRMCLTNYLTQTIVCVIVFYGFGFGIGPRFGMPGVYHDLAVDLRPDDRQSVSGCRVFDLVLPNGWRSMTMGEFMKTFRHCSPRISARCCPRSRQPSRRSRYSARTRRRRSSKRWRRNSKRPRARKLQVTFANSCGPEDPNRERRCLRRAILTQTLIDELAAEAASWSPRLACGGRAEPASAWR